MSKLPSKFSGWLSKWLMALCTCIAISGCNAERDICLVPKTASLTMQFVHFPTDTATATKDTALPHALFGAITTRGVQSVYYTTSGSVFTISLSPDTNYCQWLITTDSLVNPIDTISFSYDRKLQFISNACGFANFYTLKTVQSTHYNIDSVQITNPSVTNDANATKQLKIFIHPGI